MYSKGCNEFHEADRQWHNGGECSVLHCCAVMSIVYFDCDNQGKKNDQSLVSHKCKCVHEQESD